MGLIKKKIEKEDANTTLIEKIKANFSRFFDYIGYKAQRIWNATKEKAPAFVLAGVIGFSSLFGLVGCSDANNETSVSIGNPTRMEIEDLKATVEELQKELNKAQGAIDILNENYSSLLAKFVTLNDKVEELRNTVESLSDKNGSHYEENLEILQNELDALNEEIIALKGTIEEMLKADPSIDLTDINNSIAGAEKRISQIVLTMAVQKTFDRFNRISFAYDNQYSYIYSNTDGDTTGSFGDIHYVFENGIAYVLDRATGEENVYGKGEGLEGYDIEGGLKWQLDYERKNNSSLTIVDGSSYVFTRDSLTVVYSLDEDGFLTRYSSTPSNGQTSEITISESDKVAYYNEKEHNSSLINSYRHYKNLISSLENSYLDNEYVKMEGSAEGFSSSLGNVVLASGANSYAYTQELDKYESYYTAVDNDFDNVIIDEEGVHYYDETTSNESFKSVNRFIDMIKSTMQNIEEFKISFDIQLSAYVVDFKQPYDDERSVGGKFVFVVDENNTITRIDLKVVDASSLTPKERNEIIKNQTYIFSKITKAEFDVFFASVQKLIEEYRLGISSGESVN